MLEFKVFFYYRFVCFYVFFYRFQILKYLHFVRQFIFFYMFRQINFFLGLPFSKQILGLKNIFLCGNRVRKHALICLKNLNESLVLRRHLQYNLHFCLKKEIFSSLGKNKNLNDFVFFNFFGFNILQFWFSFFLRAGNVDKIFFLTLNLFKLCKNLKLRLTVTQFFLFFFLRLVLWAEPRALHRRRRRVFVPFLLSYRRQFFLVLKTFKEIINKKQVLGTRLYVSSYFTIGREFKAILMEKSEIITRFDTLRNLAYNNRSNAHFRW